MKKLVLLALSTWVSTLALANTQIATPQVANTTDEKPDHKTMFAMADTDGNGQLSKAELKTFHEKRMAQEQQRFDEAFNQADADKNGQLNPEEMKTLHKNMHHERHEKLKELKDKIKDAIK